MIEVGLSNRTIQIQVFDNTIKKFDIQIDPNDPTGMNTIVICCFIYFNKYFIVIKVFIQIELYISLLDVPIVMGRIHQLLNINSMSICSVSVYVKYLFYSDFFSLFFIQCLKLVKICKNFNEKEQRHFLLRSLTV